MNPSLKNEMKVFLENKARLLQEGEGKFVLITGETIAGFFSSEEDALQAGYEKVGNAPFLVKFVAEDDPPQVVSLTRLALSCQ